jgi:hypothetical protein
MKRILTIFSMLIVCTILSYGQTTDSITMKKVFGGYQFYQGEVRLNMKQLVGSMSGNVQAFKEIQAAHSTYVLASIIGGAGGFLVGWPLGAALAGGEPNWALAGVGAGLIVVSIPISQKFNRQVRQAVNTYNGTMRKTSFWNRKREINLSMSGTSAGLVLKF